MRSCSRAMAANCLSDGMVWIWHPQVTPKLGCLAIEGKNPITEVLEYLLGRRRP